ncbi:MAG: hypothetical protein ACOVPB_03310 [Bacteroidia bacterium]
MNKKLFAGVVILISTITCAVAQPQLYRTAIGLNAGYNYGITLKHYLTDKNMVEGIANFNYGPGITVLYEFNNRHPFDIDELDWYYGAGAHVKFINGRRANVFYNDLGTHINIGIDAILGLEYTLKEVPLNLGINIKPELNFTADNLIWFDGALTIRYVLK